MTQNGKNVHDALVKMAQNGKNVVNLKYRRHTDIFNIIVNSSLEYFSLV